MAAIVLKKIAIVDNYRLEQRYPSAYETKIIQHIVQGLFFYLNLGLP